MNPAERKHLTVQLKDKQDLSIEVGVEDLGGPLLMRAGVVDINHVFNMLPDELIQSLGTYPNIETELWPIIFEVKQESLKALGKREIYYGGRDHAEHWLYPVTDDGMIAEIAKTPKFQRLFGVYQLGPSRHYPIHNFHTRAQHSIYLAIDSIRTLQDLDNRDSEKLLEVLRKDMKEAGIAEGLSNEDILAISADLLVTSAMIHDLATPAGGDTIKYLLDLDEEENLADLLEGDEKIVGVLRSRGLDERHLKFCVDCVQGKSDSLIGRIIHPVEGDEMDGDRRGYTELDQLAIGAFGHEIPTILLPVLLGEIDNDSLSQGLDDIKDALQGGYAAITGRVHDEFLPVSLVDPSEDYVLNCEGRLVCTRPDKLAWLAAYRSWMIALHYAGPQMLGVEYELQERLKELIEQGKTGDIFEPDNIVRQTDEELYTSLSVIEDEELRGILDRKDSFAGTTLFYGVVSDQPVAKKDCFARFPLKLKPGLDSLILDGGEEMTLGEWLSRNNQLLVSKAIRDVLAEYRGEKGKWLVVHKKST